MKTPFLLSIAISLAAMTAISGNPIEKEATGNPSPEKKQLVLSLDEKTRQLGLSILQRSETFEDTKPCCQMISSKSKKLKRTRNRLKSLLKIRYGKNQTLKAKIRKASATVQYTRVM